MLITQSQTMCLSLGRLSAHICSRLDSRRSLFFCVIMFLYLAGWMSVCLSVCLSVGPLSVQKPAEDENGANGARRLSLLFSLSSSVLSWFWIVVAVSSSSSSSSSLLLGSGNDLWFFRFLPFF